MSEVTDNNTHSSVENRSLPVRGQYFFQHRQYLILKLVMFFMSVGLIVLNAVTENDPRTSILYTILAIAILLSMNNKAMRYVLIRQNQIIIKTGTFWRRKISYSEIRSVEDMESIIKISYRKNRVALISKRYYTPEDIDKILDWLSYLRNTKHEVTLEGDKSLWKKSDEVAALKPKVYEYEGDRDPMLFESSPFLMLPGLMSGVFLLGFGLFRIVFFKFYAIGLSMAIPGFLLLFFGARAPFIHFKDEHFIVRLHAFSKKTILWQEVKDIELHDKNVTFRLHSGEDVRYPYFLVESKYREDFKEMVGKIKALLQS